MKPMNALKGFKDLYPKDKAMQNYIFDVLKNTASFFGYEEYDGPLVEPVELYLEKSSRDLVENQTFQVKSKKEENLVLRPEMTATLARMVANKENELTFPLKLFNLGLRYRYEAPQKGRAREFYQADFDILGGDPLVCDFEILSTVVNFFLAFKADQNDFVLFINSRKNMQAEFMRIGIDQTKQKELISLIDRKDKLPEEIFREQLEKLSLTSQQIEWVMNLKVENVSEVPYFKDLFELLNQAGIDTYIKYNPLIVRGLDYYTDLVFEVKTTDLNRSLLGGGRYDNLISYFGGKNNISGVGFATSDVVLQEFLTDKNLLPEKLPSKKTKILVTVFSPEMLIESMKILQYLRRLNIASELYLDPEKKLDKQIKYADRNDIPYVLILGPEEVKNKTVKIKNLQTGEQKELSFEDLQKEKGSLFG